MNHQPPKRAAIYARSATAHSQSGEDGLYSQVDLCRGYCDACGYALNELHISQDIASGVDYRNRAQLKALLIAASNHEFDVVVIVAYDRFARNPLHVVALLETLHGLGIQVELTYEHHYAQPSFMHLLHAYQVEQLQEVKRLGKAHACHHVVMPDEAAGLVQHLFEGGCQWNGSSFPGSIIRHE